MTTLPYNYHIPMVAIQIKKLTPDAILPTQNSPADAGYDLYSVEEYMLQPGERKVFPTNLSLALPHGYYARIAPRSGLAAKHGIDVLAGVIDAWYRGDYGVVLLNTWNEIVHITKWMRIAQMIVESCHTADFLEVEELEETQRWDGWWGSSGR